MGPRERLKTAGMLKAECQFVIASEYRTSLDTLNKQLHRSSPDELVRLETLRDDVIRCNCMEAKKKDAFRILEIHGFDSATGMKIGGAASLPEGMRNSKMQVVEIRPDHLLTDEDGNPIILDAPELSGPDEDAVCIKDEESPEMVDSQQEEQHYSEPDRREFLPLKKLRGKRVEVSPDEMEKVLNGYTIWLKGKSSEQLCTILHCWEFEKDPKQIVYIYIDGDCVPKQAEHRVPGGVEVLRETKERRNHYNAVICAEGFEPYYVTYPENIDNVCKMILAVLLQNQLLNRNLVFFMDGERILYTAVERYFGAWNPCIYLDWYHLLLKVFGCLSNGLVSRREDDPRTPLEYYKRGMKKGQPKPRKKTSISVLYARMLSSILWVGNVEEAKIYIKNINPKDIQKPEAIRELLEYLENKGKYITCYALRKRAGLRNSSNIVESANRRMVSGRQKHKGMLWGNEGTDAVTALTVLFMNKEEDLWFDHHKVTFAMRTQKDKTTSDNVQNHEQKNIA